MVVQLSVRAPGNQDAWSVGSRRTTNIISSSQLCLTFRLLVNTTYINKTFDKINSSVDAFSQRVLHGHECIIIEQCIIRMGFCQWEFNPQPPALLMPALPVKATQWLNPKPSSAPSIKPHGCCCWVAVTQHFLRLITSHHFRDSAYR